MVFIIGKQWFQYTISVELILSTIMSNKQKKSLSAIEDIYNRFY